MNTNDINILVGGRQDGKQIYLCIWQSVIAVWKKTQQKKPLDFDGAREGEGNHCYLVGIRWSFIIDNIKWVRSVYMDIWVKRGLVQGNQGAGAGHTSRGIEETWPHVARAATLRALTFAELIWEATRAPWRNECCDPTLIQSEMVAVVLTGDGQRAEQSRETGLEGTAGTAGVVACSGHPQ